MTIRNRVGLLMLGIAAAAGSAQAQIGPARPSLPLACSLNDLTALEQRVVDATAFLIPKHVLFHDKVADTYSIDTYPFEEVDAWDNEAGVYNHYDVCSTSQFYGVETIGNSFWGWGRGRTATMIGRDLFLTAAHSLDFSAEDYRVVFLPAGFPCTVADLSSIPADNVYVPQSEVNIVAINAGSDFHYFYVDRNVVGRKPLKIRRSGNPTAGDSILQSGHSYWSGVRVSRYGTYLDQFDVNAPQPVFDDLFPYVGASGGPVFNIDDEVVETVVSRDISGGITYGSCFIENFNEPTARSTNASTKPVSSLIPRQEVSVTPLDRVVHVAPVGGTLAQPVTTYQLRGGGSGANDYVLTTSVLTPTGTPTLVSSIASGSGTLSALSPTTWTLTAGIASVTQCGIWDRQVTIHDVGNDQNNYVRHRFEIGVEQIEVTPETGVNITDFGYPVTKTYTYTLKNVRPSTATLTVKALAGNGTASSWLRVDGVNTKAVTLQPKGLTGDTANIVVSVVEPMLGGATLPPAFLHIEHDDPTCVLLSPDEVVLPFNLSLDHDHFNQLGGDETRPPFGAAPYGTAQVTTVEVDEAPGYCVADVDASIALFDATTGSNTGFPLAASFIRIKLKSPTGTQVTLWDKNADPGSSYFRAEDIAAYGSVFPSKYLLLDDEVTPPLVSPLSAFDGEPVEGDWEFELAVANGGSIVIPMDYALHISVSNCPP